MTIGCFVVKETHVGSSAMLRHLCIENIVSFIVCNLCASFLWHRSNTSVMSSWYLPQILTWNCKHCFGANSEANFTLSCSWWCRGERVRSSLYSSSPPPGTSRPCPAASAPAHHNWRGVEGIIQSWKSWIIGQFKAAVFAAHLMVPRWFLSADSLSPSCPLLRSSSVCRWVDEQLQSYRANARLIVVCISL